MPDEENEANTKDTEFGVDLASKLVELNERSPIRVAVVVMDDGTRKLEIRRMYYREGKLRYGKGVRLRLGRMLIPSEFSLVMDAIQECLDNCGIGEAWDYWQGFPEHWPDRPGPDN